MVNRCHSLERPWWWPLLHLSYPMNLAAARLAGGAAMLIDLRGCRSNVVPVVRRAVGCSLGRAYLIAWRSTASAYLYAFDSAGLLFGPEWRVRQRAAISRFVGLDTLRGALSRQCGVVLATSFHACLYYAQLTPFDAASSGLASVGLHLIVPRRDAVLEQIFARISAIGGRACHLISMDEPTSAVQMARALRAGDVVLCVTDNIPNDTAVAVVTLFGSPALMPAGFLVLADWMGAPVLVCRTERAASGFVTTFETCSGAAAAATQDLQARASALSATIEAAILRDPGEWNSWPLVSHRWAMAAALVKESII